jgi:hypothetical protein
VYVRLAVDWADPTGAVHGAGEFVDIDVVTLAELEERGVVENAEEINRPGWIGPGAPVEEKDGWIGPGDEPDSDDSTNDPTDDDSEDS